MVVTASTESAQVELNRSQLLNLLPHDGQMCLLDAVMAWDEKTIECITSTHQASDNPLRHEGKLPVEAGIEYAAQAMAIHGTLKARRAGRPRMGVLAVLTKVQWQIDRLDLLTAALHVKAKQINQLEQGASYQFELHSDDQSLVQGEAIIALQGE
jgi:predicted hotdog family 3-hydroxylacyl-ACP dehydratase